MTNREIDMKQNKKSDRRKTTAHLVTWKPKFKGDFSPIDDASENVAKAIPKNPGHCLRVSNLYFGSENSGIQPSASNSSQLPVAIRCQSGGLKLPGRRISAGSGCAHLRGLLIQDGRGDEASPNVAPRTE